MFLKFTDPKKETFLLHKLFLRSYSSPLERLGEIRFAISNYRIYYFFSLTP